MPTSLTHNNTNWKNSTKKNNHKNYLSQNLKKITFEGNRLSLFKRKYKGNANL